MKKETLKRDLCARLMEGVKVSVNEEVFDLTACATRGKFGLEKHGVSKLFKTAEIKEIKPCLFDTSALTKHIQIANYNNGEPFVPADEMAEIIEDLWFNDEYTREQFAYEYVNGYVRLNPDIFEKINNFFNKVHINYRLSPDQIIEVTEEFNPYK